MKNDLGVCGYHHRSNEAYCQTCRSVVCADCIMFGPHLGHPVLAPAQAAQFIREQLKRVHQAGRLSPAYTQKSLEEIRAVKQEAERLRSQVLAQVNGKFDALKTALKRRQEELKQEATEHFRKEIEQVQVLETHWTDRKEKAQALLKALGESSDQEIIRESCTLLQQVDELSTPLEVRIFKLLEDFSLGVTGARPLGHSQLVAALENLGEFSEPQQSQFPC